MELDADIEAVGAPCLGADSSDAVRFRDSDGDEWEFQLNSGRLAELVNGEVGLDPVELLEWHAASRMLDDGNAEGHLPADFNIATLRDLASRAVSPPCLWEEVLTQHCSSDEQSAESSSDESTSSDEESEVRRAAVARTL